MASNREQNSRETSKRLFGIEEFPLIETDPDFYNTLMRFQFGENYHRGILDEKTKELVTITTAIATGLYHEVELHTKSAINVGCSVEEIKETAYQCGPYVGLAKVAYALKFVNAALNELGISPKENSQQKVTEENRLEEGIKVQTHIFGDVIPKMRANAPNNQKHIQDALSAMCFGDFYTRGTLDLKMRELITLIAISSLGGCENQVKAHVNANINVGNTKEMLIDAVSQCLIYIGFPRMLNALACINEIVPENK
ncbi:4-carboxymuconolactone decarboxylase [Tritrichomonas foetus]|uniref:4-carboxymuconolactone decarboxylase n=1 Tax=Tritrichomonas foetus TaxID=1144522 RepID=A0A1J4JIH0_9EUKA|nr:4-carboxymuconolactone decarboxylase [Tritrichomonas foetus]|eukprot:OHS98481.1 4-carboxymuconolactone decarboxylase [Tritrichomonas foetus]